MPDLVGVGLALGICFFATLLGLDRDRAFYPTVTIVSVSYYALFAVMGASAAVLGRESAVILLFVLAAAVGFKRSMWVVVAALFAHGAFDLVQADLLENPGVPIWWPRFCLAYDITTGAYLALLLSRSKIAAPRQRS